MERAEEKGEAGIRKAAKIYAAFYQYLFYNIGRELRHLVHALYTPYTCFIHALYMP
jgi:hypothetical protein